MHIPGEEYESGNPHYMEYGGGIWANSYEDGMIVTLGPYQIIVEEEIIEEAPEAATDPAVEAPAAETAAAPAAAEPAAQTSDGIAIAVLAVAASLGCAMLIKKRRS